MPALIDKDLGSKMNTVTILLLIENWNEHAVITNWRLVV